MAKQGLLARIAAQPDSREITIKLETADGFLDPGSEAILPLVQVLRRTSKEVHVTDVKVRREHIAVELGQRLPGSKFVTWFEQAAKCASITLSSTIVA